MNGSGKSLAADGIKQGLTASRDPRQARGRKYAHGCKMSMQVLLALHSPRKVRWPGRSLIKVKAVLSFFAYQARVGPENHKMTSLGATPRVTAAEDTLSAAIVAEIPLLRRHAVSLLYNPADAEDLVQDCLETALAKQATLKDPLRVRPWMFAIINNLFRMRLRHGSRRPLAASIEQFADSLAAAAPPEDRAAALDIARAMGNLSLDQRQILLLISLDGYSYQDVAEILEVPIGTVMSRLARARARLRALIEGRDLRTVEE